MQVSANRGSTSSFIDQMNYELLHPKSKTKQCKKLHYCLVYLPLRQIGETITQKYIHANPL